MLKIERLNFSYPGAGDFLKDINLSLGRGEKTALIGPNGSGKTTLFLLCCGILEAQSGEIRVNGRRISQGKFNPDVSYLFQSPDDQLFSATIFDDVAFGPLNMGCRGGELKNLVAEALRRVGGGDLAGKSPHHLSGGEKRMAAIATLLSMNPSLMIFDEPTANLDNRNRRKVIDLIGSLDETLLISSHDLEFLLETCTRALLIDEGRIVTGGPIGEILGDHALMEAHGLEKPHSLIPHAVNHHPAVQG